MGSNARFGSTSNRSLLTMNQTGMEPPVHSPGRPLTTGQPGEGLSHAEPILALGDPRIVLQQHLGSRPWGAMIPGGSDESDAGSGPALVAWRPRPAERRSAAQA